MLLLDVTDDRTLRSPINETSLDGAIPPHDPIVLDTTPCPPVGITVTEEPAPEPDAMGDSVPIISQTQDDSVFVISPENSGCVSDNDESLTSQAAPALSANIDDLFQPKDADCHAIFSHKYTAGIFCLLVEYSTGDTESIPYTLVQSDDPLAVTDYMMGSSLSTTKAEAHLARLAHMFVCGVQKTVCRIVVINHALHSSI